MLPAAAAGGILLVKLPDILPHLFHPAVPTAVKVAVSLLATGVLVYGLRHAVRQNEEVGRHEEHGDAYTLSDAGLEISGEEDLELMSWNSMTRVHETDRFFLFVAGGEVQYLPKRVLDATQEAQVRGLIARHRRASGRSLPPASHA